MKESLLKSQSSVVLFNNQEKIYHLRLSLICMNNSFLLFYFFILYFSFNNLLIDKILDEFKKEELSNEDAFREMKFEK